MRVQEIGIPLYFKVVLYNFVMLHKVSLILTGWVAYHLSE